MDESSRASISARFSSPGMPKIYSTPSFSRQRTKSSAVFMRKRSRHRRVRRRLQRYERATNYARSSVGAALLGARLVDEEVHDLDHGVEVAVDLAAVDDVFAVDNYRRCGFGVIETGHFLSAAQLGLDREGIEGLFEIVVADALLGEELHYAVFGVESALQGMDGVEQGLVGFVEHAERLGGVISAGEDGPVVGQYRRHAAVVDVGGQSLGPAFEVGLKAMAMWTAIPEQLYHFDLAFALGGLGRDDTRVIAAFFEFGGLRQGGKQQQGQQPAQNGFQHCITYFCHERIGTPWTSGSGFGSERHANGLPPRAAALIMLRTRALP